MPLLLLLLASSVAATPTTGSADAERVAAADRELNRAITSHDVAAAASLYSDDFLLTTSSGKTKDKSSMLADVKNAALVLDVNETSAVTVRVHEGTAVLTATLRQHGRYNGAPVDADLLVTDTWTRTDDGWKLMSGHATLLPPAH